MSLEDRAKKILNGEKFEDPKNAIIFTLNAELAEIYTKLRESPYWTYRDLLLPFILRLEIPDGPEYATMRLIQSKKSLFGSYAIQWI